MSRGSRRRDAAVAEVTRLEQAQARWLGEADAKTQLLAELKATRGDVILADDTGTAATRLAGEALELEVTAAGAREAAASAARKLRMAQANVVRVDAAELQERATAKHREADSHQGKVDALLRQLRDLDGVDYSWREPEPEGMHAVGPGAGVGMSWTIPTSYVLRREADELDAQVAALEARAAVIEQGADSAVCA